MYIIITIDKHKMKLKPLVKSNYRKPRGGSGLMEWVDDNRSSGTAMTLDETGISSGEMSTINHDGKRYADVHPLAPPPKRLRGGNV